MVAVDLCRSRSPPIIHSSVFGYNANAHFVKLLVTIQSMHVTQVLSLEAGMIEV